MAAGMMQGAGRTALMALAAAWGLAAAPASAGDPSGVDPAELETCLAAAADSAARIACAGRPAASCEAFWAGRDPNRDQVTVRLGCLDAEQQLWEARLTEAYEAVLDKVAAARPDEVERIREAERAWIAFRDARCRAEVALYGHGTGGAVAEPECRLAETARQVALLRDWQEG